MILYHITKTQNLLSIFSNGLIPQIGELSSKLGETKKRIYLFSSISDMNNALMNWLGIEYGDDIELSSLIISLPDDFEIIDGEVEYEKYSYNIIEPKYIKFFREE